MVPFVSVVKGFLKAIPVPRALSINLRIRASVTGCTTWLVFMPAPLSIKGSDTAGYLPPAHAIAYVHGESNVDQIA